MTTMLYTETHLMKLREWVQIDNLDWEGLSRNPNAIQLLEKNLDKVYWSQLSANPNPNAIHILEQNLDKMTTVSCWAWLSSNPNAIRLLEKNLDKVNWASLSYNPNIFTYDYKAMKDRMFNN